MKITGITLFLLFLSFQHSFAQNITINGIVKDTERSEAMPGVSVSVKGAPGGTTTDAEGRYSLSAPPAGTLIFSFVGYVSQEIQVGGRSLVNVTLAADNSDLNQVVV